MQINEYLNKILPSDTDLLSILIFIGSFAAAMLLISIFARIFLGKNSSLNRAISTAMGLLCIYAVSAVIYTFDPENLTRYLVPLPFVTFAGDKLLLFSFSGNTLPVICHQLLSMLVLTFLVNRIDDRFPRGKSIVGWIVYRSLGVLAAMVLHFLVHRLTNTYIPGFMEGYAPMILVCILLFMFSLGFLKLIIALVLTAVNPLLGALYAFFFSSKLGKQISKALCATAIITVFMIVIEQLGYTAIPISAIALESYIPLAICLMILWFVIGYML